MDMLNSVVKLLQQFVTVAGGIWGVWGVVVLAGGLKDHNGPGIQAGIWQIVGGALMIAAATLLGTVIPQA